MVDEQPKRAGESTPPFIDLSTRTGPLPGPLTKPAPVIRPQKRRRRWVVLAAALIVLAGLIAGGIAWSSSTQSAPQTGHFDVALDGEPSPAPFFTG